MGQTRESGEVEWFQILRTERFYSGNLALVGDVTSVDFNAGILTTFAGVVFHVDAEGSDCGVPLDEAAGVAAYADWTTGSVVHVACLFRS
jgi:hypothetical protein